MTELGDALELMHGARRRFASLRAVLSITYDGDRARLAAESNPARDRDDCHDFESSESTTCVWLEQPDRLRIEVESGDGTFVQVSDGDRWSAIDPEDGFQSSDEGPEWEHVNRGHVQLALDPAPLLDLLRFEVSGRCEVAGRDAIRLRGRWRYPPGSRSPFEPPDEHAHPVDVVVDAERGVLLRVAALLDEGEAYAIAEMTEVAFDHPLAADLFRLAPPAA